MEKGKWSVFLYILCPILTFNNTLIMLLVMGKNNILLLSGPEVRRQVRRGGLRGGQVRLRLEPVNIRRLWLQTQRHQKVSFFSS